MYNLDKLKVINRWTKKDDFPNITMLLAYEPNDSWYTTINIMLLSTQVSYMPQAYCLASGVL
jgi:hypothetical protein